ncbi:16S rRNA (guanine(966)-N(2))-methyltransferase RsmD [Alloacidobacterium dinghuense]|uniref:16S rRNA (Guanine(966)-N(2))-methyltransferase RsmD n=1 Tax=Alloacidobacterium dinghuense TaxID=2763107 RepID=A0A7G8BGV8_9BACT|nr:16S rRNA (guanine(966)-N(2))-methyltransferase RsmD [Alloacidobacterium dinghuense]QNI31778.1 16S rRNA (guanine(966)-N(2))-methyltransferase RsmD [Alloacidobacterium dinghuense]
MRVIAGKFRSRALTAPRGLDTRPTSDRLRETLFNVLAPRIEGATFLDLYAGSGANGIEALSRGAKSVVFVEKAVTAVAAIRSNLQALGIRESWQLETRSALTSVKRLREEGQHFDIVFLDPPYKASDEYALVFGLLGGECASIIADGAIVIAEHHRKQALVDKYGNLQHYRLLEQGDAALSFYSVRN